MTKSNPTPRWQHLTSSETHFINTPSVNTPRSSGTSTLAFGIIILFGCLTFISNHYFHLGTEVGFNQGLLAAQGGGRVEGKREAGNAMNLRSENSSSVNISIDAGLEKGQGKGAALAVGQTNTPYTLNNNGLADSKQGTIVGSKEGSQGGSRIHAVTYASHGGRDDRFCRAVESAVRHDIDLVILGWGVKWTGLSQKLEAAHSYVKSLPGDDIILFTDAFDVLFTDETESIRKKFQVRNWY